MNIFANLQGFVLDTIIPMIVLLGLLIFVHELGHFLVAKFFKVRVEVFSLGFGKKIIQFVRGPTTYCISLIPLGGYVKMFGDDPNAEIPPDQEHEAFNRKPVSQRIWIVLAGPLMNFFFAIFLFAMVGSLGERMIGPTVGDIKAKSYAGESGFVSGDVIQSIDGQSVQTWKEVEKLVETNLNRPLQFSLLRDGNAKQITVDVKEAENKDPLKWSDTVGKIEGLTPYATATVVGVDTSKTTSPAMVAGLKPLDRIAKIDGKEIQLWRSLEDQLTDKIGQGTVKIEGERFLAPGSKGEAEKFSLELNLAGLQKAATKKENLSNIGIEIPELYLIQISEDMPAEKAGLKPRDKILSISGKPIKEWQQVIETVNSFKEGDGPFQFAVLRNGKTESFALTPKINTFMNRHGQEVKRFQVGIGPAFYSSATDIVVKKSENIVAAVVHGWDQTIHWTKAVGISFLRMIQGRVSSKNIGGIVTIGQVASQTFKAGISPYLNIMAIISINLFILNLLPIPILDGGHLVFYSIEALRGAPLSMKKLEIAQQIGLIILMSLMAYALFNDISRVM